MSDAIDKVIGESLRKFRKRKGMTQIEIGDFLELHQSAVVRIEQGKQRLTLNDYIRLKKYYGFKLPKITAYSEV